MLAKTKVILFGAGLIGRQVLPKLGRHVQVLAFADNDPGKHGAMIAGIPVIAPARIPEMKFDLVLISSTSISDIHAQLIGLGISKESIVIPSDAEAGAPEFPWDAVLFLALVVVLTLAALIYGAIWWLS